MDHKFKIYLGADHAGFRLKTAIKKHLDERGWSYKDLGDNKMVADDSFHGQVEAQVKLCGGPNL